MIHLRISADAFEDLKDGRRFYDAQEPGLGDYFTTCLRADIERLRISGGIHRIVYRDYHRSLSKTFPCAIFYTMKGSELTVWAVIDCRRDPDWIRRHLES